MCMYVHHLKHGLHELHCVQAAEGGNGSELEEDDHHEQNEHDLKTSQLGCKAYRRSTSWHIGILQDSRTMCCHGHYLGVSMVWHAIICERSVITLAGCVFL